jgi:hypothetical protein
MKKITVLFLVAFAALHAEIFAQINVRPVNDNNLEIKENAILYFLPKTSLFVEIDIETEYTMPGPFAAYAEKYLSIKNASNTKKINTNISNIEFYEQVEPDPDACFLIMSKANDFSLSYNNIGVISGFNVSTEPKEVSYNNCFENDFKYLKENIHFTDYSVKRNFTGRMDTTYKVIQVDSIFQKIPVYNETITSKNFEQKAEEAANYIIKIRKRRFKLQSAQFETEHPPSDVPTLIKELDNLEKQYLELFTGKKISIKNTYVYHYNPNKNLKEDKILMFHLSNELGILENPSENSQPVYLAINKIDLTNEIELLYDRRSGTSEKTKGLYYRIPGHANISVVYEDMVYSQKHIIVPQYGMINYLPSSMFKNKKLQIIFDEKYGSIKSIKN